MRYTFRCEHCNCGVDVYSDGCVVICKCGRAMIKQIKPRKVREQNKTKTSPNKRFRG